MLPRELDCIKNSKTSRPPSPRLMSVVCFGLNFESYQLFCVQPPTSEGCENECQVTWAIAIEAVLKTESSATSSSCGHVVKKKGGPRNLRGSVSHSPSTNNTKRQRTTEARCGRAFSAILTPLGLTLCDRYQDNSRFLILNSKNFFSFI